jgi:arginyl-tRNA synthetase
MKTAMRSILLQTMKTSTSAVASISSFFSFTSNGIGREQTWKQICEASRNEFDAIYKRLDVKLIWRGESFYNPRLRPLVDELVERGIAEDSDGAMVATLLLQCNSLCIA